MKDICVLYNVEDVEDFAKYLEGLFKAGDVNVDLTFHPIGDLTDLKDLSSYKILILLCSPCMTEFFDNETEIGKFKECFANHPCLVCLQYFVENDAIFQLQTALSIPKGWKLFSNLSSKAECTETIGSILDILEEQNRVTPPKPPKPIKKRSNLRVSRRAAKLMPSTIYKTNEQIAVILQKPPNGTVQISFIGFDKIIDAKEFNETTYLFRVPPLPKLGEIRLSILSNNEKIADCTLKMVKPNLAAYECLDFLAQVLGVDSSDKQSIDAKLVTLFDKSIPSDGTLAEIMKIQAQDMPFQELTESDQEVPTLLHFAAKHGLEELACTIMDTPGSSAAFQIENKDGHDPSDMAELNGFEDLAEHMRTHFETHTMVEYIHLTAMDNIYSNQENLQEERDQQTPGPRSQSFKVKSTQDKPQEELKPTTLPRTMRPPPPVPVEEEKTYSLGKPADFMGLSEKPISSIPTAIHSPIGSTTHDELLEIGNAVRSGEFTVEEAERLYASWVDRNKATQSKSLKERQTAINELRQQYQTVFKPTKERKSIFSKLKQKVTPKKKGDADEESPYVMQIIHPTQGRGQKTHRPGRESTISNSSSSSGGSRASNVSQESWQDSSRGSMQEDSESDSDDIDGTPIYQVERRQSESKESSEKRVSLRDKFLQNVQEEVESPSLPPRTSDSFSPPTITAPPPPRKDRLPPPIPTAATPTTPTPTSRPNLPPPRKALPKPLVEGRPLPNLPPVSSTNQTQEKQEPSPISKRPPAPIPTKPTNTNETKPSYKLPPRPPKKPKS